MEKGKYMEEGRREKRGVNIGWKTYNLKGTRRAYRKKYVCKCKLRDWRLFDRKKKRMKESDRLGCET